MFFFILFHLSLDVGSVEGLAYHRAWDTVYWTSSTTSSISRHTVDQSRPGAYRRQPVVTMSEDDHPHVLALDECQKLVTFCCHIYTPSNVMTCYFNNSTTSSNSNQVLETLQRIKTKTKNSTIFSLDFILKKCKKTNNNKNKNPSKLFQSEKVLS